MAGLACTQCPERGCLFCGVVGLGGVLVGCVVRIVVWYWRFIIKITSWVPFLDLLGGGGLWFYCPEVGGFVFWVHLSGTCNFPQKLLLLLMGGVWFWGLGVGFVER